MWQACAEQVPEAPFDTQASVWKGVTLRTPCAGSVYAPAAETVNHGVQHYSQGSLSAAQMCWEQAVAAPGAEAHMQGVLQNLRQVRMQKAQQTGLLELLPPDLVEKARDGDIQFWLPAERANHQTRGQGTLHKCELPSVGSGLSAGT